MPENWLKMTACDLGRGIEEGEIDPVELTEAFLDAIQNNAFRETVYARTTPDRARAEAAASAHRARHGTRRHLLDGVPVSWKDLYDTAGVATESGSKLLAGRVPDRDAQVLENASASGLVCLGKTHQTELAFSGLGLNPSTETPPNALNHSLAPGGSSSGAAVSTALGLAAAGIGSDTGGSVRIPAAWNNLVGLKTTSGLLSLDGVVPLCARFDTIGPLCRSVEDAAQITAVMANAPAPDLRDSSMKNKRLAVCRSSALPDIDPEPRTVFDASLEHLTQAGAQIEEIEIPEIAEAMDIAGMIFTAEAYGTWGAEIEAKGDLMYPPVRRRFEAGRDHSAADFVAKWQYLDRLRKAYHARVASYDAVLLPTAPILPPEVSKLLADEDYFTQRNLMALRNTRVGNMMGLSALTVPTGVNHCGLMLLGKPFGEAALLRLGRAAEIALAV